MLLDLGVAVIKIEKPGGDPARDLGPYYHDEPDTEKSPFWFASTTSKRGITLNIEKNEGKVILKSAAQVFSLYSLANLYLVRHELRMTRV